MDVDEKINLRLGKMEVIVLITEGTSGGIGGVLVLKRGKMRIVIGRRD